MTVEELAARARRGAVSLAGDPAVRHYSPATIGLVYERTIACLAGAGTLEEASRRLGEDPALADVPDDVLEVLVDASYRHFAGE